MLIFPKLVIRDGRAVYPESAVRERLYEDPVQMVKLLRVMNARSVLIIDDRQSTGPEYDWTTVRDITRGVSIPVQLEACTLDSSFIAAALEADVYRCVITVDTPADARAACKLISEFGAQRLTVRFSAKHCLHDHESVISLVRSLADSDCSRLIVTLDEHTSWRADTNLERVVKTIVDANLERRFRITVDGGVLDAADLLSLAELAPVGVDSVALFEPFFASRFPCQAFWCWNQRENIDLEAISTAELRG